LREDCRRPAPLEWSTLTRFCRGNAIKWLDMINKLKLVREIADEIWPGQP
jgi:hypothetical protein